MICAFSAVETSRNLVVRLAASLVCCVFLLGEMLPSNVWAADDTNVTRTEEVDTETFARQRHQARLSSLYASIQLELVQGNIFAALKEQESVVSELREQSDNEAKWRLACEELYLNELQRVEKMTPEERSRYSTAVRLIAKGIQKSRVQDFKEAESYLSQAREAMTAVVGPQSSSTTSVLEKVAQFKFYCKEYDGALKAALQAAEEWSVLVGPKHPNSSNAHMLAAIAARETGDYELAENLARGALVQQRQLFGSNSLNYANSLTDFCRLLILKKQILDAEAVAMQAIFILERNNAGDSPLMGSLLYNLADISVFHEEYLMASQQMSMSRKIHQKYNGNRSDFMKQIIERSEWIEQQAARASETLTK